ncbi:nucleolar complex protein 2 homolog [Harmonia axyridis]|uniref:nucleolar complex protein 2 homolog n=1 Tax=Harmonia axyridis TaxID=115357 RepID=UPI001E2777C3|nr:nucleolar complex protein 2 homolog [Harmonia axyridis]
MGRKKMNFKHINPKKVIEEVEASDVEEMEDNSGAEETWRNSESESNSEEEQNDELDSEQENESDNEDVENNEMDSEQENESDNEDTEGDESEQEKDSEDEDDSGFDDVNKHKESLQKLKETDPEFYKFLEENDKDLLNFNLSDDENDDDDQPQIHVPELGSDESDYEDENTKEDDRNITFKLLKKWQVDIKTDKSNKTLYELSQALHAALLLVLPEEEAGTPSKYKVEGSAIFNGVVQLCVLEFGPAIKRFLGLDNKSKEKPHQCKKFKKVKTILKCYFEDLLKLLKGVASANIQTVLLKHMHYMSSMLTSYPNITKDLLKQLIKIWGVSEEGVRVIAFFCILKISRHTQPLLDLALKSMFITFVKNSKFVSPSSLPSINFMRRSLVEMFALDTNLAYQHVFLYIRQLAIHLRNAMTVNKKENVQAVYNWQFVNSLQLWGNLLSVTCSKPQMQQLIYPFIQVCLGTLKLVPTAQYYPLRFHVTQILINLSRDADVFIPVLPFIVDILDNYDFNKKHQKISMKPLKFTFILRLSKSQLLENGFKDTVIDTIYDQLMEYMAIQSSSISFVELSLLTTIQIKKFLKKCKNGNYVKKMKQALEKIEQNNKFIENERRKMTINLADLKQVEGFENQLKCKGTPLSIYYESWIKIRNQKKRKEATMNDELGDYNLPTNKKRRIKNIEVKRPKKDVDFVLSESEDDEESQILRKKVDIESD